MNVINSLIFSTRMGNFSAKHVTEDFLQTVNTRSTQCNTKLVALVAAPSLQLLNWFNFITIW